jgi:hypothetical protein
LLIARGADIEKGYNQWTPLTISANHGHDKIVHALLTAGADKTAESRGHDAVAQARKGGHEELARGIQSFTQPSADTVILHQEIGSRTLEEVFNFAALERISIFREGVFGKVEAFTRESFSDVVDQSRLKQAFDAHVKRGGKTPESTVFPAKLDKKGRPSL